MRRSGLFFLLMSMLTASAVADQRTASYEGYYSDLLQTLHCPSDAGEYGELYEFGYWTGGVWCGQEGVAGYWVWSAPNWYIWGRSRDDQQQNSDSGSGTGSGGGSDKPAIYNYDGGGSFVGGKRCSYVSVGGTSMRVCD